MFKKFSAGSCSFPKTAANFWQDLMRAHNSNFASKFSQDVGFPAPNFFQKKIFSDNKTIFRRAKIGGVEAIAL